MLNMIITEKLAKLNYSTKMIGYSNVIETRIDFETEAAVFGYSKW